MMYSQDGTRAMPLLDGEVIGHDEVLFFASRKKAVQCAENHRWCQLCGYKIFKMD